MIGKCRNIKSPNTKYLPSRLNPEGILSKADSLTVGIYEIQDYNNLLPDNPIHARCAYNVFSDFNNTIYRLWMGGKPISDILPQVPVEDTNSSVSIAAYHFTAILIISFLQAQPLNVISVTFTMATERSSLSNVSDFPFFVL